MKPTVEFTMVLRPARDDRWFVGVEYAARWNGGAAISDVPMALDDYQEVIRIGDLGAFIHLYGR